MDSPLWFAYKVDRAREKARILNQQADEYEQRFHELMSAVQERLAEHLNRLRDE